MTDYRTFDDRVFVINKHSGPTSFDVVHAFRKATGMRKVGHTGTLDPLAHGVLLLCTGRATRAVEHFMNLPKEYEFDVFLGVETTTLDAEGEVVRRKDCPDIGEGALRDAAASFVGPCDLDPPVYSALKRNGKRLYELARAGETPEVESRNVTIYDMQVVSVELPNVRLRVRCSRGTYVRSLARDFGTRFDMPAHISRLTRTTIGSFGVEGAFDSRRLFEGDIDGLRGIPLGSALEFLPAIVVSDSSRRALFDGALPEGNDVVGTIGDTQSSDAVRIIDRQGRLLAVGNRPTMANRFVWVDSYRLFVDPRSAAF